MREDRMTTEMRRAMAEWLNGVSWDHFITLTFEKPHSAIGADKRFRGFIRRLEQSAQQRVDYFWISEFGRRTERLHLHALTANTRELAGTRCAPLGVAWGMHRWLDSTLGRGRPTM